MKFSRASAKIVTKFLLSVFSMFLNSFSFLFSVILLTSNLEIFFKSPIGTYPFSINLLIIFRLIPRPDNRLISISASSSFTFLNINPFKFSWCSDFAVSWFFCPFPSVSSSVLLIKYVSYTALISSNFPFPIPLTFSSLKKSNPRSCDIYVIDSC